QRGQHQRVEGRQRALAQQEEPVVQPNQRVPGDQPLRPHPGLAQRHHRQQASPPPPPPRPPPARPTVPTVNRQATPTTITAPSMVRVPTKPSAILWFCRFRIV